MTWEQLSLEKQTKVLNNLQEHMRNLDPEMQELMLQAIDELLLWSNILNEEGYVAEAYWDIE